VATVPAILEIEWPVLGARVRAEALDFNNELFAAFCQHVPFKTIQLHAMVTGEDIYAYCPGTVLEHQEKIEKRVRICDEPEGYIAWSGLGLVAIVYGPCGEPLSTQPIARVVREDIETLKYVGREVWDSIFNTKRLITAEFKMGSA
jgi:hypothetical protein